MTTRGAAAAGVLVLLAVAGLLWVEVSSDGGGVCAPVEPRRIGYEVQREIPHDVGAFTQGLVLVDDALWESTGQYGESELRRLDPTTGAVLSRTPIGDDYFGEGLAVATDGRLVQLTWTSQVAFRWDPDGPEKVGEIGYDGEGWGLASVGEGRMAMSDGSDTVVVRDEDDFSEVRSVRVESAAGPTDQLNELEWDGERLWANRWKSSDILRIDLDCGVVDGVLDASGLVERAARMAEQEGRVLDTQDSDVLNGIAQLGEPGSDRFLLTGKRWPVMFEVVVDRN